MKELVVLFLLFQTVFSDFSKLGCFPKSKVSSGLSYSDNYIYQSSGHCEEQCSGSKYAALIKGSTCYCGDTLIDEGDSVSESNCDTPCQGFGYEDCGGDDYFLIYADDSVEASSAASSSSSSSSKKTSSTATSSTAESTTESSTTEEASSSTEASTTESSSTEASSSSSSSKSSSKSSKSDITKVSTITSDSTPLETTVTETKGSQASATSSSDASSGSNDDNDDQNNSGSGRGLSKGAIAGIVVGSVGGVALLAALAVFFLWYKRRHSDDDEDDDYMDDEVKGFHTVVPPPSNNYNNVNPNPFMTKNSTIKSKHAKKQSLNNNSYNSNSDEYFMFDDGRIINGHQDEFVAPNPTEDYGRRRLSDGSLPDMATKNELKVVNN